MLSDAIRRRLEQLNRAPIAAAVATESVQALQPPASYGGGGALAEPAQGLSSDSALPRLLVPPGSPGECENEVGKHWRWRRMLSDFYPAGALGLRRGQQPPALATESDLHPELAALASGFPEGALYLDLETCGFAGSMIFLVGLVWHSEGQLWLDQLLARNYAEESAVLATLWRIVHRSSVLVTFNGKSFDWPMVNDRSTLHRLGSRTPQRPTPRAEAALPAAADLSDAAAQLRRDQGLAQPGAVGAPHFRPAPPAGSHDDRLQGDLLHCDLLHHARRCWRGRLPDCRLQTLERAICRRHRSGDVPGSQVPRVYHQYVRSGDLRQLAPVLHHNALDLLTLVEIGQCLVAAARHGHSLPGPRG